MRTIGLLLLLAAVICWLPMVFSLVSPMWWHDWFGDTTKPSTPRELADWIAAGSRLATLGTGVAMLGIVFLILGAGSNHQTESHEHKSSN